MHNFLLNQIKKRNVKCLMLYLHNNNIPIGYKAITIGLKLPKLVLLKGT